MPNSRQKIINYILEQRCVTVEELSAVFRVTQADIRHHLSILVEQGSLKVVGQKPAVGRGRPSLIFSSCQQSESNNLDRLSAALLSTVGNSFERDEAARWFDRVARHIGLEFSADTSNPTRRLYVAIHALNRMNYQAHWEAHMDHPRIMLGHCPYQVLLKEHPLLCQMDASLLENLLGVPVRQVEKQSLSAKDLPECVFITTRSV